MVLAGLPVYFFRAARRTSPRTIANADR